MGLEKRALAAGYTAVQYMAGCIGSTACESLDPNLPSFLRSCIGTCVVVLGLTATGACAGAPPGGCPASSNAIEGECCDRCNVNLPGMQQQLLEIVKNSTGTNTVLMLINAGMLAVNWADNHIDAILRATYPGQSAGDALAAVLFGDYNPAGRLWPAHGIMTLAPYPTWRTTRW